MRRTFSRGKLDAVRLVRDRGVSVAQAARDLDVQGNVLLKWVRDWEGDPRDAFTGQSRQKPEQEDIYRPRREVAKLKAERDILEKPRPTSGRTSSDLRAYCESPWRLARDCGVCRWMRANGRSPPSLQRPGSQFRGAGSEPEVGCGLHLHLECGKLALRGDGDRSVLGPRGWLVDEDRDDVPTGNGCADDGDPLAEKSSILNSKIPR